MEKKFVKYIFQFNILVQAPSQNYKKMTMCKVQVQTHIPFISNKYD